MAHKALAYLPAGDINRGDLYTSYGEKTIVYEVQGVAPRGKHEVTLTLIDVACKQVLARGTRVHLPNDLPVAVNRLIPEEPKAPVSFQEKLEAGYYTTKLPFGNHGEKDLRTAYRADVSRLNDEFRRDLEAEHCDPRLPQALRDTVYSYAWERGHSDGHYSVYNHYSEYHDLAVAAFIAGVDSVSEARK